MKTLGYLALGFVGGALAVAATGIGYAIADWQHAAHRTLTHHDKQQKGTRP